MTVNDRGRVWPTGTDYSRAIQTPHVSFTDPELVVGRPGLNMMGMPMVASGQNAVVFLLETATGQQAVRCFLRPPSEGAVRYSALERHLADTAPRALTAARWLQSGMTVDGTSWPVVVMPWVEGNPLNIAVEDMLDDPAELRSLAAQWGEVVRSLQRAGIAHGDLQHGNVLVKPNKSIALVDLDGVWVPEITVGPPAEFGHPNYQHPQRTQTHWGKYVDTFPGALIELAMNGLAADPSLQRFLNGENLLFMRADLEQPKDAGVWDALCGSPDTEVAETAAVLRRRCEGPIDEVLRPYDELLEGVVQGQTVARALSAVVMPSASLPPAPDVAAEPNWWEQPDFAGSSVLSIRTDSASSEDSTVIRPVASRAAIPAAPVRASVPSSRSPLVVLGRNTTVAGLFGGALAGVLGSLSTVYVDPFLNERGETLAFIAFIGLLLGGFLLSFQSIAARNGAAAFRQFGLGAVVGVVAALLAVLPANLIVESIAKDPACAAALIPAEDTGCTPVNFCDKPLSQWPSSVEGDACVDEFERVPFVANMIIFAMVAGAVGWALGSLRSWASGFWGLVAGVASGLAGGALFGAIADYDGVRLDVHFLEPTTIAIVAAVCAMIGVVFGAMVRARRTASLTIIEGRNKGLEIAVEGKIARIGAAANNDLVLKGDASVRPSHAFLHLGTSPPSLQAFFPVQQNGVTVEGGMTPLADGDVLLIGHSFVRFELKGATS